MKFDPKQSRAKKWAQGSLGTVLKDFMSQESRPCLLSGLPVPALGIVGSHTRALVLEVPLYGRLTFPAFPKLSPAEQNTLLSLGCHAIQTLNQPYAAKLGQGVWLMDRSVGP